MIHVPHHPFGGAPERKHGLGLSGDATKVLCGDGVERPASGGTSPGVGYLRSGYGITDNANDNFAGASLDTAGTRFSGATAWAWVAQATATAVHARDQMQLTIPASTGGWHLVVQNVPSGTWLLRAHVGWPQGFLNSTKVGAMVLYDSVGGRLESWGWGISPGGLIWAAKWTNLTTLSATRATIAQTANITNPCYWEIENDGTNYILRYGINEANMVLFTSFTHTNFLANAADKIGLGVYSDNAAGNAATMYVEEFFRVL